MKLIVTGSTAGRSGSKNRLARPAPKQRCGAGLPLGRCRILKGEVVLSFAFLLLILGVGIFGSIAFVRATASTEQELRERRTARDLDMRKPVGPP